MAEEIEDLLKGRIIEALKAQGFDLNPHVCPAFNNKAFYRKVQKYSRLEQIEKHKKFIEVNFQLVQKYLLNSKDLDPSEIDLELREVKSGTKEEILFRWWNLVWWSVPYQRAYGRQMRFLVWDKGHNAPFGLIGLQSPVLKMEVRDSYLKIPKEDLDIWINRSMQAQRLGALPPYNYLLGGKMVAMAMTSNEVLRAYRRKYKDRKTLIRGRIIDPNLLFITTTSAFGRSSIYNRLKYGKQPVAISLGYTKGSGTFHIPGCLYREIIDFLRKHDIDVSTTFGNGPSRKIKLLSLAFKLLNLPNYSFHNMRREFFLFPLVSNLHGVISDNEKPKYYDRLLDDLVSYWKERWCLPRAKRTSSWKHFLPQRFIKQQLEISGVS